MVELRQQKQAEPKEPQYASSFAGDVINFAVYLKRLDASSCVHFLSATGHDELSGQMRAFLSSESIDSELVAYSPDKTVGLYMIHTDDDGERTFTYWRSDSAARQMFQLVDGELFEHISDTADYFYFSGITLAILPQSDRDKLFAVATSLRNQGKTIVFDPNYRPALWANPEEAKAQINRAYGLTDILLSSYEDEQSLFELNNSQTIHEYMKSLDIDEVVMTDGPKPIHILSTGDYFNVSPSKPERIVDTTSAGDAFNAGYIEARYRKLDPIEAAKLASNLANQVIGQPGAIVPKATIQGISE